MGKLQIIELNAQRAIRCTSRMSAWLLHEIGHDLVPGSILDVWQDTVQLFAVNGSEVLKFKPHDPATSLCEKNTKITTRLRR